MDKQTSTIEIDIIFLLKKLWERKFMILFSALLVGAIALGVSLFVLTPRYTSTTKIYVGSQRGAEEGRITTQDLQAGDYLVKDYKEIIISKDVLLTVIDSQGLELTDEELLNRLTVSIPTNTRIISISVEDEDPSQATLLANAVRDIASEKIKEITQVEKVTTMEVAEDADEPSSPNTKRNLLLGGLVGGFLATVGVLLSEVLDDRIKRPEDIEDVLGIPLLGIVPNLEQLK